MRSLFISPILYPLMRWWIGILRTDRSQVGRMQRLLRGALLVPPMLLFVAAVRMRRVLVGPLCAIANTPRGLSARCELSDLIQMYIALFDVWEPDLTAFVESRLQEGDSFIDVGANVGWLSLVAALRVGELGVALAIEPARSIHEQLYANITRNGLGARVRLVRAAASDVRGEVAIHSGPAWNTGLTSTVARRGLHTSERVPAAPLADLLHDVNVGSIRIIKIDVEGGEKSVLAGMVPLLDRFRADIEILIELSPAWWTDRSQTPDRVLRPFVESGFFIYRMQNSYWPWRYLWPSDVRPARRVHGELDPRARREDIVLSRVDAEELEIRSP